MEENKAVSFDYKTVYKQKEDENKYLKMQLEELTKDFERKVSNLNVDLIKYEKENKWLKDIISSILHI